MNEPDVNIMAIEKLENSMILLRSAFSDLRADNMEMTEALEGMNVAIYKLEQKVSDVRKAFLQKGVKENETDCDIDMPVDPTAV